MVVNEIKEPMGGEVATLEFSRAASTIQVDLWWSRNRKSTSNSNVECNFVRLH
jgi:hypothetical protein